MESGRAERALAAERQISRVRLGVVALGTLAYAFFVDQGQTTVPLAWALVALAWLYSLLLYVLPPSRALRALVSGYGVSVIDGAVLILWILATGGYASPFYPTMYVAVVGVAFRSTPRGTFAAALLYAAAYVGLLAVLGSLAAHFGDVVVRVAYVFLAAAVGALLSREALSQVRARREVEQFAQASTSLTEELDLGAALAGVVGVARRILKADRGAVYLLDEARGALTCSYSKGLSREYIEERTRRYRGLPSFEVLAGESHFHVPDARTDPRSAALRDAIEREGFRTYLVVPLRLHGETLGLLTLYRDEARPFARDELDMAHSIAGHAAAVLHNARLVQELRASESRFRSLVESMEDVIFTADRSQRLTGIYGRWIEKEGLDPASVRGRPIAELLGAEEPGAHETAHARALAGEHVVYEWAVNRPYGPRTFQTSLSPVRDSQGTIIGVVGVGRDVTDQKRTEAQLKDALSLLTATLESTADGIVVVDLDGRISSFNQQFIDLWRIPQSVLASRDDEAARAFFLDQLKDPQGFFQQSRELQERRQEESFDVIEFKDGRVFERYSKPQRLGAAIVGRVWSFRDITERIRADRDRQAAHERLQELERLKELDRFKTQFINTAAHELGTPLTPITLQVHMLRTGQLGRLEADQQKALEILSRNVERLAQLVADVLEVARLQAGRLSVNRQPMDLNQAVREAVESFQEPAVRAGITLEAQLTSELPVVADGKRLIQVLFNLVGNALKFTPPGGRIVIETHRAGPEALLRVRDSGIGLRPQDVPKLFQPFSQVHDPMQRTRSGTGLGLFISRGIVEQHGGRVWVESEGPNQGATFTVALPLDGAAEPRAAAVPLTSSS